MHFSAATETNGQRATGNKVLEAKQMARKKLFGVLFDGNRDQWTIGNEQRATGSGNGELATGNWQRQLATATGNGNWQLVTGIWRLGFQNMKRGKRGTSTGQGRGKDGDRNRQRESWANHCNGP